MSLKRAVGFTFLEIMLVVAIIAVVAAVAIPRFAPSQDRALVKQAAQQLQNDLLYFRQLAETKGTPQTVVFNDDSSYTLNGEPRHLPPEVVFLSVNNQAVPPATVTAAFDYRGRLTSDLIIKIKRTGSSGSAPEATVTVKMNTGLAEVTYP